MKSCAENVNHAIPIIERIMAMTELEYFSTVLDRVYRAMETPVTHTYDVTGIQWGEHSISATVRYVLIEEEGQRVPEIVKDGVSVDEWVRLTPALKEEIEAAFWEDWAQGRVK